MRIDKYLWAVRIFKTRTLATEACRAGKVLIAEQAVKPSREVKIGELISVKKMPITFVYKVLALLENRVSAKLVINYIEDITPSDEFLKLEIQKISEIKREKGTGRPTKKDRRSLNDLFDS